MEIEFPIEFLVHGTPVSLQARRAEAKAAWRDRIRTASTDQLPSPHFSSEENIAITLYYFPVEPMQGDLDNIVKPILDALSRHVYIDDQQVERILVQKFEPDRLQPVGRLTPTLEQALEADRPVLYVRITNDLCEE